MFIGPVRIAAAAQQHCANIPVLASGSGAAAYLSRSLHIYIAE